MPEDRQHRRLTAVLRALEACLAERVYDVCIITDSFYTKNGISSWIRLEAQRMENICGAH